MRAAALLCLVALTGCDQIEEQWVSWRYASTSYAVAHCVSRNADLAKNVGFDVRKHCARKHATVMSEDWFTKATGGFDCSGYPRDPNYMATDFVLTLRHNTNYVLTRVTTLLNFKDNPTTFHFTGDADVWLESGHEANVSVQLLQPLPCREVNIENHASKWTWELVAEGVKAAVR